MRKLQRAVLWVGTITFLLPLHALALAPPTMDVPQGLSFAEIKITGDEFLVLQNNTGTTITDLSSYWLENFNNMNPLAAGVSNSSQQLPQVALGDGQTLLLSSTTMPTCGSAVAGKLSLSLTDSGGFLELVQLTQNAGGAIAETPGDVVNWSSSANGLVQNVPSNTKDPKATYYRYRDGANYPWQLADIDTGNTCQLDVVQSGQPTQTVNIGLGQSSASPPATILSLLADSPSGTMAAVLPPADLGLLAPQLSELLPNPNGTGTDGSDEFVELYNPNEKPFDLSGFSLQVGTTTTHNYTFPAGTLLPAKAFKAFYSSDTGLSMSNTAGQAVLLDPFGTQISMTEAYGTAKDGQAWALAKGKWYWTTNPTPGGVNVINQPATSSKPSSSTKKVSAKNASGVKGASTVATAGASTSGAQDTALTTPIHPWTLALVALAALLYGAYEYRVDIRNRFAQYRADRAARRVAG